MPLHILSPGFLTTIQDLGRPGYERYGVPEGGAMDRFALMAANALVGNPLGAAGLEFTLAGPSLWLEEDGLVALAGRGFALRIDGRPVPAWMAAWVRRGEIIEIVGAGLDDDEPAPSDAQTRPYPGLDGSEPAPSGAQTRPYQGLDDSHHSVGRTSLSGVPGPGKDTRPTTNTLPGSHPVGRPSLAGAPLDGSVAGAPPPPGWGYLALAGGVAAPEVLGSRSAWLKGGLGGLSGVLQAGDVLPIEDLNAHSYIKDPSILYARAGLSLPVSKRPAYDPNPTLDVVLGMQANQFRISNFEFRNDNSPADNPEIPSPQSEICNPESPAATTSPDNPNSEIRDPNSLLRNSQPWHRPPHLPRTQVPGGQVFEIRNIPFFNNDYILTPACDRMGYRLSGPPVTLSGKADILSEGIPLGAIQVPGDGQPIVLLADRQTTGGYPKLGAVTSASLPLLVQTPVGGRVRFRAVSVEEAQHAWRRLVGELERRKEKKKKEKKRISRRIRLAKS